MPGSKIPIIKTLLATISIFIINLPKIVEIILVPFILALPMLLQLIDIMPVINQAIQTNNQDLLLDLDFGIHYLFYFILFIYALLSLHINLYRLSSIGSETTFRFGIVPIRIVLKLLPFYFFVNILLVIAAVSKIPFLEPIVIMLLANILLKFVAISNESSIDENITISFIDRLHIAIIQFIIPMVFLTIALLSGIGLLVFIVQILAIFFRSISLGLIFNSINK